MTPKKHDDGYIKFDCEWHNAPLPEDCALADAIACRQTLYDQALIGMYDNGVGYGNISIRYNTTQSFIITGSGTGAHKTIKPEHFTHVTHADIKKNQVVCHGPVKASSESMTHAALYACDKKINAVIHIHSHRLWEHLINTAPTTPADIPYGTPEMAGALKTLYKKSVLPKKKIVVMAGHEEGIVSFGESIEEASLVLMSHMI